MTRKRRPRLTARNADKHELYQTSVNGPEHDVAFLERVYKNKNGELPRVIREDFCGTALLCAAWAKKRPQNRAIGVDLHEPTLEWGREHNVTPLGARAKNVKLVSANVLDVTRPKVDVLLAMNFSYFIFKQRQQMLAYFRTAKRSLKSSGVLILDLLGGPEAQSIELQHRKYPGFKYVWRQSVFEPVSHDITYHIDFEFKDGSRMKSAFTYEWRLWTIPELRDLLADAGFSSSDVYWENTDSDTGEGNGVYRLVKRAPADHGWVAHIVGHP